MSKFIDDIIKLAAVAMASTIALGCFIEYAIIPFINFLKTSF